MDKEKSKIIRVVNEIVGYYIGEGATEITVKIEETKKCVKIHFKDPSMHLSKEISADLKKKLNFPRFLEVEDYYGEMVGTTSTRENFTLIGAMTDLAIIENEEEEGLSIILIRSKNADGESQCE